MVYESMSFCPNRVRLSFLFVVLTMMAMMIVRRILRGCAFKRGNLANCHDPRGSATVISKAFGLHVTAVEVVIASKQTSACRCTAVRSILYRGCAFSRYATTRSAL